MKRTLVPVSLIRLTRLSVSGRAVGRDLGLILALALALGYIGLRAPGYFSYDNFLVIAFQMSFIAIAALGMAPLIIGGNVDLSIGSMFGLSAVTAAILANHLPIPLAIASGIAVGGVVGAVNGALVWRIPVSPIIITLGMLTLLRGVVDEVTGGFAISAPDAFASLGRARPLGVPLAVLVFLALLAITYAVLHRTTIGRHIFAIGGNREASLSAGLPVRRLVLGSFVVNGILVGIAGVFAGSYLGSADPSFGIGFELDVITAVILGGIAFSGGEGRLSGVVLAVALLGVIQSGVVALGVDPAFTGILKGGILILAVGLEQLSQEQRDRYRRLLAMRGASK